MKKILQINIRKGLLIIHLRFQLFRVYFWYLYSNEKRRNDNFLWCGHEISCNIKRGYVTVELNLLPFLWVVTSFSHFNIMYCLLLIKIIINLILHFIKRPSLCWNMDSNGIINQVLTMWNKLLHITKIHFMYIFFSFSLSLSLLNSHKVHHCVFIIIVMRPL